MSIKKFICLVFLFISFELASKDIKCIIPSNDSASTCKEIVNAGDIFHITANKPVYCSGDLTKSNGDKIKVENNSLFLLKAERFSNSQPEIHKISVLCFQPSWGLGIKSYILAGTNQFLALGAGLNGVVIDEQAAKELNMPGVNEMNCTALENPNEIFEKLAKNKGEKYQYTISCQGHNR